MKKSMKKFLMKFIPNKAELPKILDVHNLVSATTEMVGKVCHPGLVKDGLPDTQDQLHGGHSCGQPQHCLQITL